MQLGKVSFDIEDDTICTVPVHPDVASDTWSGRTLDLSRAYKQLALDKASRLLSVADATLPFGAIAAVYSFNRVSRSLHHLICKLLWARPVLGFYDDCPTISSNASSAILSKAMSAILTLLGWDHAKVGVEAVDFASASAFNALGVSVQLDNLNKGAFILCNKEGRIERLCGMLEAVSSRSQLRKYRVI